MSKILYMSISRPVVKAALAGAVIALLLTACGTSPAGQAGMEQRAQELNKNIMCPICPGESIDQSQATIALQMREIVREKLDEGWTDDQIQDFFVDRYGPSVLMEPPTDGFSIMAWIVPPVVVVVAIIAFLMAIRRMRPKGGPGQSAAGRDHAANNDDLKRYYERIETALEPHLTGVTTPESEIADSGDEPNG